MTPARQTPFPKGIVVASLTPMDHDLNADMQMLVSHCKKLFAAGADGVVLLGTTGEANSFSLHERMSIVEGVIDRGVDPRKLMFGTGCCALTDTIALTKHAFAHGIQHVLMLPPFYYKPVSDNALFEYFTRVIESIGEKDLRIFLYHIPQMTGIDLSLNLIEKLLDRFPVIVAGMKDSSGNYQHTRQLMQVFPQCTMYSGSEEYLLDMLRAGGAGSISATANVSTSFAADVVRAFRNNKEADVVQGTLTRLRYVFQGVPFVGALKGFLAMRSGIPSWNYLRPPNIQVDNITLQHLMDAYQQIAEPVSL